jgi:hypothetical protein
MLKIELFLQRLAVLGLGVLSVWLIAYVFRLTDREVPTLIALSLTYAIGAYLILPRAVRIGLKILQQQHVPRFTLTADGLAGDPVNLALVGDLAHLRAAFAKCGWVEADALTIASSWRMVRAFVLNKPYPAAPFSTLYLFGRGQDIGFQKAIGGSPRKRHHVRFWAQDVEEAKIRAHSLRFWLKTSRPMPSGLALWIGAGTRDTGFSLTRLTFQITHATDSDTNAERNFIIEELTQGGSIRHAMLFKPGERLARVNHYVADGEIAVAEIAGRDERVTSD